MNYKTILEQYGQTQYDEYLHRIGDKLQLSETQKDSISKSYEALAEYIENNSELLNDYEEIKVYSQGSYALSTVNRPLRTEQFDIDIVVEFPRTNASLGPQRFYNSLVKVFSGESRYREILELKNRCVRINYTSSNYYFDILPVVPTQGDNIKLAPDKELKDWVRTSPKKYRDWFEVRCKNNLHFRATDMALEELPKDNLPFSLKPALKRSVQLIKRARDIYFRDDNKYSPSSIVLTTLFAMYYNGESSTYQNMKNTVEKINKQSRNIFTLNNPVDAKEEFTEKWKKDHNYYDSFFEFFEYIRDKLAILESTEGIHNKIKVLSDLFGESTTHQMLDSMSQWHNDTAYGVNQQGRLTTEEYVVPAKKNNFYGSKD